MAVFFRRLQGDPVPFGFQARDPCFSITSLTWTLLPPSSKASWDSMALSVVSRLISLLEDPWSYKDSLFCNTTFTGFENLDVDIFKDHSYLMPHVTEAS